MKKLFLVSGILLLFASGSHAKDIELNDLAAPDAPAYVLLGVEPNSIEKPSSPRAFALSTLNLFTNTSAAQPQAIEVSPYWLFDHSDLDYKTYSGPGFFQRIKQTASFSIATDSLSGTGGASPNLGLGLRVDLLSGDKNPEEAAVLKKIQDSQDTLLDKPGDTNAETEIKNQIKKLGELERVNWISQFAVGASFDDIKNAFNGGSKFHKWGAWSTNTYRLVNPKVDCIGLVRVLGDSIDNTQTAFDAGLRILFQEGDFSFSGEYLGRWMNSGTVTSKLDGEVGCKVAKDILLTANYGRDFTKEGRLLVGLKFNGNSMVGQ